MDPLNCNNPNVKFLLADWERLPGFGISAQIAGMCGLLAIAINEIRVLLTNFYKRADHDGCKDIIIVINTMALYHLVVIVQLILNNLCTM